MPSSTDGVRNSSPDKSSCNGGSPITVVEKPAVRVNKIQQFFSAPCDAEPKVIKYVTLVILGVLSYALLFSLLTTEVAPKSQLFALILLVGLSCLSGWIVSLIHLPPLLGMLICGIVLRNIGFFEMSGVYLEIVVAIREIALTVILLKAGLGLDAYTLLKLSFVVARLATAPCITEAAGAAVGAYFLLGMPWLWGLLLGSVMSAVSPAVVVPTLLSLKERGYGEDKGISTLVIAASSIDDIISISGFGVIFGLIFSEGDSLISNVLQGPIEVVLGLFSGIVWGLVCACFPHRSENYLVLKRSIMVGGGSLVAVLGSGLIGYSGSGPLAAIVLSFVASLCWKWQGWSNEYNPVSDVFSKVWYIMQPLLFGLIGTEINFEHLNISLLGRGFGVLMFGLVVRILTCCVVLIGANLNLKEVLFVNLAWLPKATVQAALGPVALDMVKKGNASLTDTPELTYATDILTIAVLSILLTAPIGAIGIALGGPRLLTRSEPKISKIQELPQVDSTVELGEQRV